MKVAIIGGGVSGLSSLWALENFSSHEVHLYESGPYIGGHTNTVNYQPPPAAHSAAGKELAPTPVDTGFIVFNTVTYPNFLRFVKYVGAEILESDMSFSVSRWGIPRLPERLTFFACLFPTIIYSDGNDTSKKQNGSAASAYGRRSSAPPSPSRQTLSRPGERGNKPVRGWFEWAGGSPAALFCQSTNLLNPSHWRMVWDIIRFNNQSLETLRHFEETSRRGGSGEGDEGTIGEWLDERGYGAAFRRNYLIPMTASIWSTPPSLAFSSFPAITLLRFMHNHHLLQILDRPQWLTLKSGSRTYVEKVLANVPTNRIHHSAQGGGKVTRVSREGKDGQWRIKSADGAEETFDHVVFACHADTTLSLLDPVLSADDARRFALSQFEFSKNEAVLHADERLMPVRRSAWSAWNFIAEQQAHPANKSLPNGALPSTIRRGPTQDADRVALTYWMNLLQSLPESRHGPVLVTLNPPTSLEARPRQELVAARYSYEHPVYTARSVKAQRSLVPLQGQDGLHFAGAWLNYGFHEDGFSSGLKVAEKLGAKLPFDIKSAERPLPKRDWALLLVSLLEFGRRHLLSLLVSTFLHPTVVWGTILLEMAANVAFFLVMRAKGERVSGQRCAIRNEFRRVRADWEESRWEDESGKRVGGGGMWAREGAK